MKGSFKAGGTERFTMTKNTVSVLGLFVFLVLGVGGCSDSDKEKGASKQETSDKKPLSLVIQDPGFAASLPTRESTITVYNPGQIRVQFVNPTAEYKKEPFEKIKARKWDLRLQSSLYPIHLAVPQDSKIPATNLVPALNAAELALTRAAAVFGFELDKGVQSPNIILLIDTVRRFELGSISGGATFVQSDGQKVQFFVYLANVPNKEKVLKHEFVHVVMRLFDFNNKHKDLSLEIGEGLSELTAAQKLDYDWIRIQRNASSLPYEEKKDAPPSQELYARGITTVAYLHIAKGMSLKAIANMPAKDLPKIDEVTRWVNTVHDSLLLDPDYVRFLTTGAPELESLLKSQK